MLIPGFEQLQDVQLSRQARVAKRLLIVFFGAALVFLMAFGYEQYGSPLFEYQGMVTRTLPVDIRILCGLFAALPLLVLPIGFTRPSDAASWMLYLIAIAPMPFVVMHISRWPMDETLFAIAAIVSAFILFDVVRARINWTITPQVTIPEYWFTIVLPVIVVFGAIYSFSLSNFQIRISLDDIYDRRFEAREIVETSSLASYFLSILNRAGIPIMMVLYLRKRSLQLFVAMVFSVVALFSFDGQKFTIFLPLASTLCYAISKLKRGWQGYVLIGVVTAIYVIRFAEQQLLGTNALAASVVHRLFELPAQLTAYYLEFFSANPSVLMTNSAFNVFLDPVYSLHTPRLIGLVYFREGINANVNIWASAFADFYYPGMFLISLVAAGFFGLIDAFSKDHRLPLAYALCSVIAMIWSQGALQTSLLSSGVLLSIAFLYVLRDPSLPDLDDAAAAVDGLKTQVKHS